MHLIYSNSKIYHLRNWRSKTEGEFFLPQQDKNLLTLIFRWVHFEVEKMVSLYSLIKLVVVAMSGEIHNHVEDLPFPNKINNNNNNDERKTDESDDSNDSLQGLSCEICRVKVTSAKIFQRHLEGRKHKLRVERQGKQFKCDLCDIIANSEIQLEIHLRSAKHKARQHRKENPRWAIFHFLTSKISLLIFVTFVCILLNLFLLFKSFF